MTEPRERNLAAERSVLGAVLARNDALVEACVIVQADAFSHPSHRLIFAGMVALGERNEPIDLVTLTEEMQRGGVLEEVGGPAYIARLIDGVPKSTNVPHYARIVRHHAVRRLVMRRAEAMLQAVAQEDDDDTDALIAEAEAALLDLRSMIATTQGLVLVRDRLAETLAHLDEITRHGGSPTAIPTGWAPVDQMIGGFEPGQLVVVGGRASMAKTSFALDVARYVTTRRHQPVAVFSQEMSFRSVTVRLLQAEGGIDGFRLRRGALNTTEYDGLNRAVGVLENAPFWLDDSAIVTVADIRHRCRRIERLGLIVIDYLQLMGSEAAENRNLEVTAITRGLKAIAKELNVPVIALSQLSRQVTQRTDQRPRLSDLRESGAIEQDADIVLLLHRPEYYNPTAENAGVAEVIIAKQREGPVGIVTLKWEADYTRFVEAS